jgi:hypothetical protein
VVLYTPTIESGVDFSEKNHFDRMYCFISNGSCSPRAFLQMTGRVRNLISNDIRCYYDEKMMKINGNLYVPTLDEFEENYLYNVRKSDDFIIEEYNDVLTLEVRKTAFTKVYAYNQLEDYLKCFRFMDTLKEQIIEKGHKYYDNEDAPEVEPEKEEYIEEDDASQYTNSLEEKAVSLESSEKVDEVLMTMQEETAPSTTAASRVTLKDFEDLLAIKNIDDETAELIENKKKKNAEDKLCLERYYIEKKFKLVDGEFSKEFLFHWYQKEHILNNALYSLNLKQIPDGEADEKGRIKNKLKYLQQILDIYGFSSIIDMKRVIILNDEIRQKMEDSKLMTDNYNELMSAYKKRMRSDANKFDIKKFTPLANSILNEYGVKITSKKDQKQVNYVRKNTQIYKLEEENKGLLVIIKRNVPMNIITNMLDL